MKQTALLPVIEGDPNDYNTIFTTLKECMQFLNLETKFL